MKQNKLILSVHFIPGNRGSLVFKREGFSFRINRLTKALNFVANMKQLLMAIEWGGEQDCLYLLGNDSGHAWFLHCCAAGTAEGYVSIGIGNLQGSKVIFEWAGTLEDFRYAVEGMIERMGRYAFFV